MSRTGAGNLRLLIAAENASLRMGGEGNLALYYFEQFRRRGIDAWLLVHERSRAELEKHFAADLDRLYFVPDTCLQRMLWRCSRWLPKTLYEQTLGLCLAGITQRKQRRVAKELVRTHDIDVVHQCTPISPKQTSSLYGLGAPLVIGPMCGGMDYPPAFQYFQDRVSRLVQRIGRWSSPWAHWLAPGKLRAEALIVANAGTRAALPRGFRGRVYEVPESGVDLSIWGPGSAAPVLKGRGDDPVRFLYLGSLVRLKAVDFLLTAFSGVVAQEPNAVLDVVGDGPLRETLKAQARQLGLEQRVHFTGWVSREEGAARLREADVFVFPSLHDCGSNAVLEAMAVGLPIVATHWGGPGLYVDDSCGIRVDPKSPEAFVAGLTDAMLKLASSPSLRQQMGQAGRRRVRTTYFDWDAKVKRILDILQEAAQAFRESRREQRPSALSPWQLLRQRSRRAKAVSTQSSAAPGARNRSQTSASAHQRSPHP
jgi:glycosyltransferase involved in cell wall biosynthesis